ncbi:hypothetical protein GCM10023091_19590 [Ravibacter arvi]|uniref:Uncharacterized protein n=2 Tax=Ravibacter arvi TaxID=2051041 RepID=A0ABP8LY93_9BACT
MGSLCGFLVCFLSCIALAQSPHYVDINVKETAGVRFLRPLTGGIPIPEGAAQPGSEFIVTTPGGKVVPSQSKVLATWGDGSARWVLIDFQADPQPGSTEAFRLGWKPGKRIQPVEPKPEKLTTKKGLTVSSGPVTLKTAPGALLRVSDRFDLKFSMVDSKGVRCEAVADSGLVETSGALRTTLLIKGSFFTPNGTRVADFRLRASVFHGLQQFYLEPQLLAHADTGMITRFKDLSLELHSAAGYQSARLGGLSATPVIRSGSNPVRLFQVDDENFRMEGTSGKGSKAPGWMEVKDGKGTMAIALRDFWQQWPKSLQISGNTASVGLFPAFRAGTFAHMGPWYKHEYLFEDDHYRVREGQTRRWQIWCDLTGDGERLVKSANRQLIPAANPEQAIATGEWGVIAAAGTKGMSDYDKWAEGLFQGYCNSIREQRDYGAMNWGDWFGERGVNWGNNEYDTPLTILTQFARTGDPEYFYVGEQAARHTSEVDVVHALNDDLKKYFSRWERPEYTSHTGMVHEHSIGHVGGFQPVEKIRELYVSRNIGAGNPNPYLCLDPYNLGHIWTEGMAYYYLLTGDPWVKETLERISNNLVRLTEDGLYRNFKGTDHSGRVNGWTMLAFAGIYRVNLSPRVLKAMRFIADEALVEQNLPSGGWMYKLPWGHCNCVSLEDRKKGVTPHVGEAGFLTSIRLNGLGRYFRLTQDKRIPNSLKRAVDNLNNSTWHDHLSGWRYTSCPASGLVDQPGVTIMALVNSVSINGDKEQLRVLKKAWDFRFKNLLDHPLTSRPGLGKVYSATMYGAPEAMNLFVNGKLD